MVLLVLIIQYLGFPVVFDGCVTFKLKPAFTAGSIMLHRHHIHRDR